MARVKTERVELIESNSLVLKSLSDHPKLDPEDVRTLVRGVTAPKKVAFLLCLAQLGNRTRAAQACGMSTVLAWQWQRDDPAFKKCFIRAMEIASDLLEDEAVRRAAEGVIEPVYQGGRLVGSKRVYSDTLLMFTLKGMKPEKYADRSKVTHDGSVDLVGRLQAARDRALGREPAQITGGGDDD